LAAFIVALVQSDFSRSQQQANSRRLFFCKRNQVPVGRDTLRHVFDPNPGIDSTVRFDKRAGTDFEGTNGALVSVLEHLG
jgi:hypothetical protein